MKLPKIIGWTDESNIDIFSKECEWDEAHHDALIQELVYNQYIICGDTHQHIRIPVFEDGYLLVSMRFWDGIMREAYREFGEIPYSDISSGYFYMACSCPIEEKLPEVGKVSVPENLQGVMP